MSFGDVLRKAWHNNILLSVLLELTHHCNLNCYFCYNDRDHCGRPLSLHQYRNLIDELTDLGVLHLTLSGGEPLVHPDFWAIARQARDQGFVIQIKSNGHLIGPSVARRMKQEVAPFLVEVSLHGACASTHERQTRVAGSFNQLMRNIQAMLEAGIRVKLKAPLTRWNEAEVEQMYAIADRMKVPLQIDPDVTPRDNGHLGPLSIATTEAGLRGLYQIYQVRFVETSSVQKKETSPKGETDFAVLGKECQQNSEKHCGAGSSGLAIDPYGNVYPCVQWRIPLGSLHSQSLREIWKDSEELKKVRMLSTEIGEMQKSDETGIPLAFCPGAAYIESGSPFKPYAAFQLRKAVVNGYKSISSNSNLKPS